MPQATAADDLELQNRIDEVKDLLANRGLQQREIVRFCLEKHPEWKVTDRQLRNYVYQAKEDLAEEALGINRRARYAISVRRLDACYSGAYRIQDFKTAINAEVQNIKLQHLDDPAYKATWREGAEKFGLDPDTAMAEFEKFFQAQAELSAQDMNRHEADDNDYAND